MVTRSCVLHLPLEQFTARCEGISYRLRIVISTYPTSIRRPVRGGSHRNVAMPFGTEKLEWLGYRWWKNL